MKNRNSNEIFKGLLSQNNDGKWIEAVEYRKANIGWLDKSAKIAIKLNRALRDQKLTQRNLAERLGVSAQQVNKILKGRENLTLETVTKLEIALGIELMSIISSNEIQERINSAVMDYHRKWTKTNEYKKKNGISGKQESILCVDEEEYALAG